MIESKTVIASIRLCAQPGASGAIAGTERMNSRLRNGTLSRMPASSVRRRERGRGAALMPP
mgnify:CR=1 FL=1